MNNTRKILAILLAIVLVLALSVSAFAVNPPDYSITVNNPAAGETYSAYKMFDLSVDDPTNPGAYRYTVNSDWTGFTSNAAFTDVFDIDAQGYVTAKSGVISEPTWTAAGKMSKLAEAAAKYAADNEIAPKASEEARTADPLTLPLTEAGYYVVSSTLGSRAMIETTPDNAAVTINEKNDVDTISKLVKEDSNGVYGKSNDAQIGDLVEFKSIVTIAPRSVNVKIHDTMEPGLTFTGNNSIKIYTDAELTTELAPAQYEILATPENGDTFTIRILDTFAGTASESQNLYVTYTATLNEGAIEAGPDIHAQGNTTHVSFGDNGSSSSDPTTTTTHKFRVYKHAAGSTDNLAGAVFSLKKAGTVVPLVMIDANNYRVANAGESVTVNTFTTVANVDIVIWGVDSDNDYKLEEITPPSGYNKLADEVEVAVNAENSTRIDIPNQSGSELPSTGGIGTTIFYIVGGILVVGAAVVLISKKRMNAE